LTRRLLVTKVRPPFWHSRLPTAKPEWAARSGGALQFNEISAGGSMKVRPLHDRILIKRVEEEQKTSGGIIIPDTAKEKPQEGRVIAVGNGKVTDEGKVIPLEVSVGDRILFGKYSGSEITLDGEEHLIIREEDVLAILGK
jgi:chaperonin GroES